MSTSRTDGLPVSVVDRISLVLEALSTGPMTLAKVTARTGLPRSSAHRLLEQLANAGWLARSPEQTYEFGVKAYELGQAALNQNRLLHHARPLMHAFAHRSGFTVQLGVVDRGDTVYLAKVNGRTSARPRRPSANACRPTRPPSARSSWRTRRSRRSTVRTVTGLPPGQHLPHGAASRTSSPGA